MTTKQDIHAAVQEHYGQIAAGGGSCCGPSSSCCGGGADQDSLAQALGYSAAELAAVPEGANLGLSCGNPTALASLGVGEVVLDLGSGAGFDVFIAAARVGASGHVHGVDMTREMVARARQNAATFKRRTGLANVTFHLGHIEALPLPDASVDAVLSNCVVNLSPDQPGVWREIARVLRPGGRVSISDLALLRPLPEAVKGDLMALVGCVAGAALLEDTKAMMAAAGLVDIRAETHGEALEALLDPSDPLHQRILAMLPPGLGPSDFVTSVLLGARKPV
ncbi:MAG: arsenite methyltransferase [Acidobacteria bacterium]|nr:arsenite methyltransferase [Acidobacteriota bacterium]